MGVVTLMMALAFTSVWVRSLSAPNEFVVQQNQSKKFAFRSENGGIRFVESTYLHFGDHDDEVLFDYPYWMIVTPLTLLSAYLLLSKPRPSKPVATSSPQ